MNNIPTKPKDRQAAEAAQRHPAVPGELTIRRFGSAAAVGLLSAFLLTGVASTAAAADVGVSIGVAQPGVYGRIDIGRFADPVLVQATPIVVQHTVVHEPVYLWVPDAHRRDWRHSCSRYGACGVPVYFVQDRWYRANVAPPRLPPGHAGRHDGHRHDEWHGRGHGHD